MKLSSQTSALGLFGCPISHSISPAIQQAALDYYDLSVRYSLWPTKSESLANEIEKLRSHEYLGANVTIPYKQTVITYLDGMDPFSKEIGAVNTIVKNGSKLIGYNTDADAFIRGIKELANFDPIGKDVLILGAGGAARAAVFGLLKEQVGSITVANRNLKRANMLVEDLKYRLTKVNAMTLDAQAVDFREAIARADLIVNATPIGMRFGDFPFHSPLPSEMIPKNVLVSDMVYVPTETPLLNQAKRAGAKVLGGFPMLIFQGASAFELWMERKAPIDVMINAGEMALAELG